MLVYLSNVRTKYRDTETSHITFRIGERTAKRVERTRVCGDVCKRLAQVFLKFCVDRVAEKKTFYIGLLEWSDRLQIESSQLIVAVDE